MSYLARLKKLDAGESSLHAANDEPTKPTEPPFDGFAGSTPGQIENISIAIGDSETANTNVEKFQNSITPLPTKASKGCAEVLWAWLVTFEDHALETYHHPEANRAEVMRKYPDALSVTPLPECLWPHDSAKEQAA